MPLPNTATIKDVIIKQQELQGINQKTELASVIGSPATSTDTVSQQIFKLQNIKDELSIIITNKGVATDPEDSLETMKDNVDLISTGEPITGLVTSSNGVLDFGIYGSGFNNLYYVEVSGLDFRPSHIVIVPASVSDSSFLTNYYQNLSDRPEYIQITVTTNGENSFSTRAYRNNNRSAYVNETGFRLPVGSSLVSHRYYIYK